MPYQFSIPINAAEVPTGHDWLHEVKYDGYRMMLIREHDRVRLVSTGGFDWAPRFPRIVEAALKLRQSHFIIDGEAVVLGPDSVSDFAALHKHKEQAQLYAFGMLAGDSEDHRQLTLSLRKPNLDRLLSRHFTASSLPISSKARSGPICFVRRATWASKALSQSIAAAPIAAANASTGSR